MGGDESMIALRLIVVAGALAVPAAGALELRPVVEGLTAPVDLVDPQDGTGRLFVVEQQGVVQVLGADGKLEEQPLLDLRPHMLALRDDFEERGLLGFALPPDFGENPKIFVSYSAPLDADAPAGWNHTRRIAEIGLSPDTGQADLATERVLLSLDWPSRKHNGGGLAFGLDGYLYVGLGDGGGVHGLGPDVRWSAFEVPPEQRHWDRLAQDTSTLFGSILRLDVNRGFPGYGIPRSNPLTGGPGRDEIWAWGFRNPYRIAFDRQTGDLLVTAPAETLWEAIYMVRGPANYGWPLLEGTHCMNRETPRADVPCPDPGAFVAGWRLERPVVEYPNMQVMSPESGIDLQGIGTAVVGARIYRGTALPGLVGNLVFADWSAAFDRPSGQLFRARPPSRWGEPWPFEKLAEVEGRIIGLAEDGEGELYVLTNDNFGPFGSTGKVLKLVP
jgi:glucose/arabinose dehydrogenase